MITNTTLGPSCLPGRREHPEARPEAPSNTPPAIPAPVTFKNSLRVRVLFGTLPPRIFQAEPIGDAGGEQGQAEDVVRAAYAGVAVEKERHHQQARQL